MPLVQITHGRDKTDYLAAFFSLRGEFLHLFN